MNEVLPFLCWYTCGAPLPQYKFGFIDKMAIWETYITGHLADLSKATYITNYSSKLHIHSKSWEPYKLGGLNLEQPTARLYII